MSKLEQNTTALDEVLAMVNALPDAGGGGDVAVDTCTVTVTASMGNISSLCYTKYAIGEMKTEFMELTPPFENNQVQLASVLCGSFVAIIPSVLNSSDMHSGVGTEFVGGSIDTTPSILYYKVTASAREWATINI